MRLRGLYAITPTSLCRNPAALHAAVAAALAGGAALIQYRDKWSAPEQRRSTAASLLSLCREAGAGLILNDDAELARAIGADGVHLGASDPSVARARALLDRGALIGASCGPSLQRAHAAIDAGASYVAFGRFFESSTKPDAPAADADVLIAARRQIQVPICAIGGITPDNGAPLVALGVDLLAAVQSVFGDPDPAAVENAARRLASLFEH
jgi:thiamine-phosphate pyrophosphorylase